MTFNDELCWDVKTGVMMKKKLESMGGVCEGDVLDLRHFGPATVRKIYRHHDTKEYCADIETSQGKTLHLSLNYAYSRKFRLSSANDRG